MSLLFLLYFWLRNQCKSEIEFLKAGAMEKWGSFLPVSGFAPTTPVSSNVAIHLGWAWLRMKRDREHEAAHEELQFGAFRLNLPALWARAGAPSPLNISDTLMAEADGHVCLVSVRKTIVFKLSLHLSATLLQSAVCSTQPLPSQTAAVNAWPQLRHDWPDADPFSSSHTSIHAYIC